MKNHLIKVILILLSCTCIVVFPVAIALLEILFMPVLMTLIVPLEDVKVLIWYARFEGVGLVLSVLGGIYYVKHVKYMAALGRLKW